MTMSVPEIRFQPSGNYEDALARAAGECGIEREYWDIFHKRHETSQETLRHVLQALGWDPSSHEAIERTLAPLRITIVDSHSSHGRAKRNEEDSFRNSSRE